MRRVGDKASDALGDPSEALLKLVPSPATGTLSLSQKLDQVFGDNEAVKCALAANLSYFHDDPATLWWTFFAMAQGSYLQSGGRYVQGGSQRLSSALARAIRAAGGEVLVRRVVSGIALDARRSRRTVTHTAKDGSDPQTVEGVRIIGNAAPAALAPLMPEDAAAKLRSELCAADAVGLAVRADARTVEAAARIRRRRLLHASAAALDEAAVRLRARRGADGGRARRADAADVGGRLCRDRFRRARAAFSCCRCSAPTCCRTGTVPTWTPIARSAAAGSRRSCAISTSLYPGLGDAVVASSFNSALSVRQYLNAPDGAVYGFAPTPPRLDGRKPVPLAAHGDPGALSVLRLCRIRRLYRRDRSRPALAPT